MNFKTTRIMDEHNQLSGRNTELYTILVQLDTFCKLEFKKEITLTCIYRTKEENDALYATTPPEQRPKGAPHTIWNAADIRSSTFTDEEIQRMLAYLNSYKNSNGKPTAIYHKIADNAFHFHVQRLINV